MFLPVEALSVLKVEVQQGANLGWCSDCSLWRVLAKSIPVARVDLTLDTYDLDE